MVRVRDGLFLGAWVTASLIGCDASTPPVAGGTGGVLTLGSGGRPATGGNGSGGFMVLCPGDSCCPESAAYYWCSTATVCRSYPTAIDCSNKCDDTPCPFGCADGRCLPDPSLQVGGTAGMGGGIGGIGGRN